jgi:hypothetical protein
MRIASHRESRKVPCQGASEILRALPFFNLTPRGKGAKGAKGKDCSLFLLLS